MSKYLNKQELVDWISGNIEYYKTTPPIDTSVIDTFCAVYDMIVTGVFDT